MNKFSQFARVILQGSPERSEAPEHLHVKVEGNFAKFVAFPFWEQAPGELIVFPKYNERSPPRSKTRSYRFRKPQQV